MFASEDSCKVGICSRSHLRWWWCQKLMLLVTDLAVTFKVVIWSKKSLLLFLQMQCSTSFGLEDEHPSFSHFLSTPSGICSAFHTLYKSGTKRVQSPNLLIDSIFWGIWVSPEHFSLGNTQYICIFVIKCYSKTTRLIKDGKSKEVKAGWLLLQTHEWNNLFI